MGGVDVDMGRGGGDEIMGKELGCWGGEVGEEVGEENMREGVGEGDTGREQLRSCKRNKN